MNAFKQLREHLGMTQEQAARTLGVTQSCISKKEAAAEPVLQDLASLAATRGGKITLRATFGGRSVDLRVQA